MTASKASTALMQSVADVALDIVGGDDCYVATTPTSAPMLAEHIAVLVDPASFTQSVGALRAAVELSQLVDYVQDGAPVFDWQRAGQSYMSAVYRALTGNVHFARASLSGEALADFERAQAKLYDDPPFVMTEAYERYAELKSDVAAGRAELALRKSNLASVADEAERQVLIDQIASIEERLELQKDLLRALDQQHHFEEALRIYRGDELVGFPESVQEALDLVKAKLFDIDDGQESHIRALFAPNRLAEENWIRLRINRQDISHAPPDSPLLPPAQAGDDVAPLDDDAIDTIELEVQILRVERPWCWEGLFNNRMWKWQVDGEPISTGGANPSGRIPAYPAALIIARNLRIHGRKQLATTTATGANTSIRLANFMLAAPLKLRAGQTVKLATHARFARHLPMAMRSATDLAVGPARPQVVASRAVATAGQPLRATDGQPLRATAMIRLPVAAAVQARIAAASHGIMHIQVVDAAKSPVSTATVHVTNTQTGQQMVKSSAATGDVSFTVDGPAEHSVTITKQGFKPFTESVTFTPGGRFVASLENQLPMARFTLSPALRANLLSTRVRLGRFGPIAVGDAPKPAQPQHTLEVGLARQGDPEPKAMDVPVRVEVADANGRPQHVMTVAPAEDLALRLPSGRYTASAHCDVYDVVGAGVEEVDLTSDRRIVFTFRARTILESDEMYLMGILCRRVPRCPDPHPDARW